MPEEIVAFDPTTNLELVRDQATGAMASRKRLAVNASGIRYKGDPNAAFAAARAVKSDPLSEQAQFDRATLGSLAAGYNPEIGGVDVGPGKTGFQKSAPFQEFAAGEATSAPLISGDFNARTGATLEGILGGGEQATTRFGEGLQAQPAQEYLKGVQQTRKDVLDAALNAPLPPEVSRADRLRALREVRFSPDFERDVTGALTRYSLEGKSPSGFGSGTKGVISALGAGLPFVTGGVLGALGGAYGIGKLEQKQNAIESQRQEAIRGALPLQSGYNTVDFSGDAFSQQDPLDAVVRDRAGEKVGRKKRGGYRLGGGQ